LLNAERRLTPDEAAIRYAFAPICGAANQAGSLNFTTERQEND
jgi:hypothetical protein